MALHIAGVMANRNSSVAITRLAFDYQLEHFIIDKWFDWLVSDNR